MKNSFVLVSLCFLFLSGCALVIEGESQDVSVDTTPEGANCTFARNNISIGVIPSTPGTLHLSKTKDDISITCDKPGYQTATFLNSSEYPKYSWAYILVGGPIGWGVDSATGADNQYASPITINLLQK